jgi:hypothetical protein
MSETNPVNNPPRVKTINVQLALQGQIAGQDPPASRAYLFNRAGKLVASRLVDKGAAAFEVPADLPYRVTVGPDLLAQSKQAPANLLAQLAQAKAISQDISAGATSAAFTVNPNIWNCWLLRCINVQGTVTKSSNGTTVPICTGTVKVFEIDFLCTIDRVPLSEFANLKFDIISKLSAHTAVTQAPTGRTNLARHTVNVAAGTSQQEMASTIASLDGTALKNYLVFNRAILGPVWCELIRFPWLCWREVAEVPIQSDGSFNAEI